jgi:hypothetical protein
MSPVRAWHHDRMTDVRQELARDGKAYGRAKASVERTREALGETIRRAAAEGVRPSEIARLVSPHLTERTVFRIIDGSDKG